MTFSIVDERDAATVVAEVFMMRAAIDHAVLIVEGPGDQKFFEAFTHEACEVIFASGRENAIQALNSLENSGLPGILCVVDLDFDWYFGVTVAGPNIVVNGHHDLEIMMIRSNALRKVIRELGSASKLRACEESGETIEGVLLGGAHALGALRLVSLRDELNLTFEELRYRFCSSKPDKRKLDMLQEVLNHSQAHHIKVVDLGAKVDELLAGDHDPWLMCCGHDVAAVFGKALQSRIGSRSAVEVRQSEIESRLRLAFSEDDFRQTDMYAAIKAWEVRQAPYRCLRI